MSAPPPLPSLLTLPTILAFCDYPYFLFFFFFSLFFLRFAENDLIIINIFASFHTPFENVLVFFFFYLSPFFVVYTGEA